LQLGRQCLALRPQHIQFRQLHQRRRQASQIGAQHLAGEFGDIDRGNQFRDHQALFGSSETLALVSFALTGWRIPSQIVLQSVLYRQSKP
jgi:hypothetical protein